MKVLTSNKLYCNICNKQYINKNSLDKHKILCDYTIKSKRERKIDLEEVEDIPSHYQLAKIVQELILNKIKMEEKMKKMEEKIANLTNSKKRKLNIVLWLNTNIVPAIGFLEWVNTSLIVKPKHFEILMENTIFYTIHQIFEENLLENTDFIYPITCFSQKNGIFYICEKQFAGSLEWKKLILDDMILILNTIKKNLIKELTKWKLKNQHKFDDDNKLSILFNKSVIKLMNVPFSQDHNLSRIKNSLYNYLKTDLKSVVEFDFEF
jgi:hypothetical protein